MRSCPVPKYAAGVSADYLNRDPKRAIVATILRVVAAARACAVFTLCFILIGLSACSWTCRNAGVASDEWASAYIGTNLGFLRVRGGHVSGPMFQAALGGAGTWNPFQSLFAISGGRLYSIARNGDFPDLVRVTDLRTGQSHVLGSNTSHVDRHYAIVGSRLFAVAQDQPSIQAADLHGSIGFRPVIAGSRTGLQSPFEIVADKNRICVTEHDLPEIKCFSASAHGNAKPLVRIDTRGSGMQIVDALALDGRGDYCVAGSSRTGSQESSNSLLVEYLPDARGSAKPVRVIRGPKTGLGLPFSVGASSDGHVFVLDHDSNSIIVFGPSASGNVAPETVIQRNSIPTVYPWSLTYNERRRELLVAGAREMLIYRDWTTGSFPLRDAIHVQEATSGGAFADDGTIIAGEEDGSILRFQPGDDAARLQHLFGPRAKLHQPMFVAAAPNGALYLISDTGIISVYKHPKYGDLPVDEVRRVPVSLFGSTPNSPELAVAAADDGTLYFAALGGSTISVFPRDGDKGELSGPATELSNVQGLAVDRLGSLYVADAGRGSLLIFPQGAAGNVRARVISGSRTRLVQPQAVTIERDGTIDVFGGSMDSTNSAPPDDHYVAKFAPSSVGNVSPMSYSKVSTSCEGPPL